MDGVEGADGTDGGIPLHGHARVRIDHEAIMTARLVVLYGPVRWFLLSRSELILNEQVDAPAGYSRNRIHLRSPLEDREVSFGVQAGPLILGAIQGQGLYHRMRDPTQGGARWSAMTDRSRFVPITDPAVHDRRGAALVLSDPTETVGFALWYLERDRRFRLEGLDWWFTPVWGGKVGRVGVVLARVRPDESVFRDTADDPWFFHLPPGVPGGPWSERRVQGLYWELDRASPAILAPRVLLEGWRQRSGIRPPLFAGNGAVTVGPRYFRATVRTAAAERGFLTLEEGRTAHSLLLASELSHRSVTTPVIMEAFVRWSRAHRWEDGQRGPYREEAEVAVNASRLRIPGLSILDRLFVKGRVRTDEEDRYDSPDIRLEGGLAVVLPVRSWGGSVRMRGTLAGDSDGDRHGEASILVLHRTRHLSLSGRTLSLELWGRVRGEDLRTPDHNSLAGTLGFPLGENWRASGRLRLDRDVIRDEQEWSGSLTVEYGW